MQRKNEKVQSNTATVLQHAENHAVKSQNAGKAAQDILQVLDPIKNTAEEWDKIFSSAHPFILTLVFLVLFPLEMYLNYELFLEITHSQYFWWIAPVIFFVLAWKIGNYLRKIHSEHFSWDIYEAQKANPNKSAEEVQREVASDTKKDLRMGWLFFVIMMFVYLGCSYYRRITLLHEGFIVLDILPVIAYALAIFASVSVGYAAKRISLQIKIKRLAKKFAYNQDLCQHHTHSAVQYVYKAKQDGEDVGNFSMDLKQAIFRHANNSSLENTYALVQPHVQKPSANGHSHFEDVEFEEVKI